MAFVLGLFWFPESLAMMKKQVATVPEGYWVCENASGYRYFSKMTKCKGKEEKDGSCNFNSSSAMSLGCKYDYALGPEVKEKVEQLVDETYAPTKTLAATPSPEVAEETVQPPAKSVQPTEPKISEALMKKVVLENTEAKASAAEFKNAISQAKAQNYQLSDQLKTGKMDLASYWKNNPFQSSIDGDFFESDEKKPWSSKISTNKKETNDWNNQRDLGSNSKEDADSNISPSSRNLASEKSNDKSATGSSRSGSKNSSDAWLTYMGQIERSNLVDQLRRSTSLKEQLLAKIQELKSRGNSEFGLVSFLEEVYQESLVETPDLTQLQAMSVKEAFSLNDEETRLQIMGWIQEFEHSDPQFLPQESLFERIQWAHRKFARKEQFVSEKSKIKQK